MHSVTFTEFTDLLFCLHLSLLYNSHQPNIHHRQTMGEHCFRALIAKICTLSIFSAEHHMTCSKLSNMTCSALKLCLQLHFCYAVLYS